MVPYRAPQISETGARQAARRLGISVEAYRLHMEAGERWCSRHERWLPVEQFTPMLTSRGVSAYCRPCAAARKRERRAAGRGGAS